MKYPRLFQKYVCYHEPWCRCQYSCHWGEFTCDCDGDQVEAGVPENRLVAEALCFAIAVAWHRYYCEYRSLLSGLQCQLQREHQTNHAGQFGNTWWQEQAVEGEPVTVGGGRN
jgi:hypothetical protein